MAALLLCALPRPAPAQEPGRAELPYLPELDESFDVERFNLGPWVAPEALPADMGRLTAEDVDYDREQRIFTARGAARLEYRDKIVAADLIVMDRNADRAVCTGNVRFDSERMGLEADRVELDFEAHALDADGRVVYRRRRGPEADDPVAGRARSRRGRLSDALRRRDAAVFCSGFFHNWETGSFQARGPVRVQAREYELRASAVDYDGVEGRGHIAGPVRFKLIEGQWLIDEDIIAEEDKLARALVRHPTEIECMALEYNEVDETFLLEGEAAVLQEGRSLRADRIFVDEGAARLLIEGDVELSQDHGRWLFDGEVVTEDDDKLVRALAREPTLIRCGRIEADYGEGRYSLQEAVYIEQPDKLLTAGRLDLDAERGWIEMVDDVTLYQSSGQWLFDAELVTDDSEKVLRALARPETRLECSRLAGYYEEAERSFLFEGRVRIEQPDKRLAADEMLLVDQGEDRLAVFRGAVRVRQSDGDWIFDNELVDMEETDPDMEELLRGETELWADYMQFDFEVGEHLLVGRVRLEQQDASLQSEAVYYRSDGGLFGVQGDVRAHKRDTGEWLYADEVRYDEQDQVLEAWGAVEARIEIDSEEEE